MKTTKLQFIGTRAWVGAVGLLLTALTVTFAAEDITIFSPKEGDVYRVGDTLPIVFDYNPATFGNQIIGLSVDGGDKFTILPLVMNGSDTVSQNKHYDWPIPDSLRDALGTNHLSSTIGAVCFIRIRPYPGGGSSATGVSAPFSIICRTCGTATKQAFVRQMNADDFSVVRGRDNEVSIHAARALTVHILSLDGRTLRTVHASAGRTNVDMRDVGGVLVIKQGSRAITLPRF